jgi:hypothetical protein
MPWSSRAAAGECAKAIAADLGISSGRVSQILSRRGMCGRVKDPGMPSIQWLVRQEQQGSWLCTGGGIARRAKTPDAAIARWKAELARKRGQIVVPETPVSAPIATASVLTGALRLSPALRAAAARAEAVQPRMLNMGSRARDGGVQ